MSTLSPTDLTQQLHWRYATKKFDASKKIPADTWKALEEALILSPSSYGLQPWKFLVITDQATREKLVPISWGQKQPVECSHYVVLAVKKELTQADAQKLIDASAKARNVPTSTFDMLKKMLSGAIDAASKGGYSKIWSTNQVYIALGQLMASAAVLGIDACPMEGIDQTKYDEVLKLAGTDYATVVACALGYRSAEDKYASLPKVRYSAAEMIQHI